MESVQKWTDHVFRVILSEIDNPRDHLLLQQLKQQFRPGKMLRSRLGYALYGGETNDDLGIVTKACAATELIHSATLFHDDVIDGASLRRGQPSLWQNIGSTGAILMGDLFFSSSLQLIVDGRDVNHIHSFVTKVREVCAKEMVHELLFKDRRIDVDTCIDVARGKTGPLFAFVAEVCGGDDARLSHALGEVGYLLGTAYQIADDLTDVCGDEELVGKTLGTDEKRRKFTLAQDDNFTEAFVIGKITDLCYEAVELVWPWAELVSALEEYIVTDLLPTYDCHLTKFRQVAAV